MVFVGVAAKFLFLLLDFVRLEGLVEGFNEEWPKSQGREDDHGE